MKGKILIFAMLLGFLLIPKADAASIVINNVSILPSTNLWIGEDVTFRVYCNGTNASIEIIGSDNSTINAELNYNSSSSSFDLTIPSYYFNKPNNFTANFYCMLGNETINQTRNFSYSKFDLEYGIDPSKIYKGDLVEVNIQAYKNGIDISKDIVIKAYLNESKIKGIFPYNPTKGRVIYINTSQLFGYYSLKVNIEYERINKTILIPISVNEPITFRIDSISTTQLSSNDTFELTVTALERGNIIQLTKDILSVKIDNINCDIISITPSGNSYILTLVAPTLSSDEYTLTATLLYDEYSYFDTVTVYYPINIEGRFVDQNSKGISTRISFYSNNQEILRIYTDSSGKYSGKISPGSYDIEFEFPEAVLFLEDVRINNFENPLKYLYFPSINIEGFNVIGVYVFETDLNYEHIYLELNYDEKKILDESLIKVYKCEKWNSGKQICIGNWKEIDFALDDVRNIVKISSNTLSAYALVSLRNLKADFELNKNTFHLKDLVKIRGIVKDEYGNQIEDVNVSLLSTKIIATTLTDKNGLFELEFYSPENEGTYTYTLKVEKQPFVGFNKTLKIKVEKSKEVSIIFPTTIRIYQGDNLSQELKIVNSGQADLTNLNIEINNVPEEYYLKLPKIEHLNSGNETTIHIHFVIPKNATPTTLAATLKVFNQVFSKEKTFGLTILEKNESREIKPTGHFIEIPKIDFKKIENSLTYLTLIAITSFSLSFILKKVRKRKKNDRSNFLIELKNYLEYKQSLKGEMKNG